MSESENKPPVFKEKVGSVEVAVWEQTSDKGNFLTTNLVRNYKDKEDNWKKTNTLRVNDIPAAQLALQKAYEFAKLSYGKDSKE